MSTRSTIYLTHFIFKRLWELVQCAGFRAGRLARFSQRIIYPFIYRPLVLKYFFDTVCVLAIPFVLFYTYSPFPAIADSELPTYKDLQLDFNARTGFSCTYDSRGKNFPAD